ncbi:SCO6880 family protein [Streptomyces sp. NRRL S-813]|uniref:SCO6880 family protein n=1 Tax=Streptomyces sp. NRRL S-813 TaxID=1463919 RepID=UPI0004C14190|nr:SCO6880 family protein [Streptomyces sp. NRRL S-813]
MATDQLTPRTYGNFRKPRTSGLRGLPLGATLLLFAGLIAVVLATLISIWAALTLAVALAVVMAPLAVRDRHGRTLMQRGAVRLAWWRTTSSGSHLYRSGPLGRSGYGTCQLPGLAAESSLTEARDGYGRPFAMITIPATGHHTAVISCDADGAALVDERQIDTWVAHWGQWLSALSAEPGLVAASVSVETAPDSGVRLQQEIDANTVAAAPALARSMMGEVLTAYPAGSAQIATRIALTYSGAARPGSPRRSVEDMAVHIGTRLPGLTAGLSITGAGTAVPMTATDLAEAVRVAYDPTVAPLVEEARAAGGTGLTWDQAGPMAAQEAWDHYRHDGAFSVTWAMTEAPQGEVFSNVLTGLVQPNRDIARKRVTLLYRPHTRAESAHVVQQDYKNALFNAQQSQIGQARDDAEVTAARRTSEEQAQGHGVVRFGLLITATVSSATELPKAAAAVDNLAPAARIAVRPVYGSQAAAFAAALPLGLVLPLHTALPQTVRDVM